MVAAKRLMNQQTRALSRLTVHLLRRDKNAVFRTCQGRDLGPYTLRVLVAVPRGSGDKSKGDLKMD